MTLEILRTKEALRELVDAYALLGDEKKISEQMSLFISDAVYTVYMDGIVVADIKGTDNLQKEFNGHASAVKTYFTLNGQHNVKINGDSATGTSFSTIKMIREQEGKDNITDYSVRYDDTYIFLNNKWLIAQRIGHFIIVEARPINN